MELEFSLVLAVASSRDYSSQSAWILVYIKTGLGTTLRDRHRKCMHEKRQHGSHGSCGPCHRSELGC